MSLGVYFSLVGTEAAGSSLALHRVDPILICHGGIVPGCIFPCGTSC
jgi:hypothetical protein